MFTGIIEEIGKVTGITSKHETMELSIEASEILSDIELGASISINGVCLTVTDYSTNTVQFDVMPESFHATNLHELKQGSQVNLERAMAAGGRFGGHLVSGHIDGVGTIVSKSREQNAVYYVIDLPAELSHYFVYKGSVAVDGTSLTVFGMDGNHMRISLIPHTMEHTVLGAKEPGDDVNIECDMIGKYVAHFLSGKEEDGKKNAMTKDFLSENGFA
ncbi:riboflavin synthase [Thalassobacillus sp. CUG 92003]|uniref:riboflavin synthase n=1 Tax=Thalassobacillus sp. CUG 92003 TaxID=2736641 RepID=UPI0015E6BC01|nr:riboflavin synthase [Thalassobacillus sp. CUG 92003]